MKLDSFIPQVGRVVESFGDITWDGSMEDVVGLSDMSKESVNSLSDLADHALCERGLVGVPCDGVNRAMFHMFLSAIVSKFRGCFLCVWKACAHRVGFVPIFMWCFHFSRDESAVAAHLGARVYPGPAYVQSVSAGIVSSECNGSISRVNGAGLLRCLLQIGSSVS